jgi:rod shape-determining protein MreC
MKRSYLWTAFFMLVLVIAFLVSGGDMTERLNRGALTVFGPLLRSTGWFSEQARRVKNSMRDAGEVRDEVGRLRDENQKLNAEVLLLRDLSTENSRLREMLGFKQGSSFRLLGCRVVSRDPSNWWNSVLINRGTADEAGLQPDLPVVSPRGVVGKTGTVSPSVTEVILLINENCKISGTAETSRDQGIVMGQGALTPSHITTRMKFLPRNATIASGERVLTNGLGGVFPPGLLIGIVSDVPPLNAESNFGLYREAVIDPAVDISQLDELFVVLGARASVARP